MKKSTLKGKNLLPVINLICWVANSYKTFFMLNSTEHEIFHANKSQLTNNDNFFLAKQG